MLSTTVRVFRLGNVLVYTQCQPPKHTTMEELVDGDVPNCIAWEFTVHGRLEYLKQYKVPLHTVIVDPDIHTAYGSFTRLGLVAGPCDCESDLQWLKSMEREFGHGGI